MGESATAVDVAKQTKSNVKYGLGRNGWILWAVIASMNFFGGMSVFSGVAIAGYAAFCLVGTYVWIRALKVAFRYMGRLFGRAD